MSDNTAGNTQTKPEAEKPRLDELMLAMDVVDTLRHHEKTVQKELAQDGRDDVLKERLRKLYEGQGLEVSDRILDEGIRALKESRFTYRREGSSAGRFWARLWVNRARTGLIAGSLLAILILWAGISFWNSGKERRAAEAQRIELQETLPKALATAKSAVASEAKTAKAKAEVERITSDGERALAAKDKAGVQKAITALGTLKTQLALTYDLRIVTKKGEKSGVFRVPKVNRQARNYYLIVEPVAPGGKVISLPIRSEEDGTQKTVSKFGVRVPLETFRAVANDKRNDGIIQKNIVGRKLRGALAPQFSMAASAAYILKW